MSLAYPLPEGVITQFFGPSALKVEPSMYLIPSVKAYWVSFPGWVEFNENVHGGVDFAGKPAGTPLVAAEAGTVTRATYDRYNGGGWVIEVEIRDGVSYSYSHCQALRVGLGAKVKRGQVIATVGATGTIWDPVTQTFVRSAYGVHCHATLLIKERGPDGIVRTFLHDFADFLAGGPRADSALIKPLVTVKRYCTIKYPVHIRFSPDLDVGATNIFLYSRSNGIFDRNGVKWAEVGSKFELKGSLVNDDGTWARINRFGRDMYVWRSLIDV